MIGRPALFQLSYIIAPSSQLDPSSSQADPSTSHLSHPDTQPSQPMPAAAAAGDMFPGPPAAAAFCHQQPPPTMPGAVLGQGPHAHQHAGTGWGVPPLALEPTSWHSYTQALGVGQYVQQYQMGEGASGAFATSQFFAGPLAPDTHGRTMGYTVPAHASSLALGHMTQGHEGGWRGAGWGLPHAGLHGYRAEAAAQHPSGAEAWQAAGEGVGEAGAPLAGTAGVEGVGQQVPGPSGPWQQWTGGEQGGGQWTAGQQSGGQWTADQQGGGQGGVHGVLGQAALWQDGGLSTACCTQGQGHMQGQVQQPSASHAMEEAQAFSTLAQCFYTVQGAGAASGPDQPQQQHADMGHSQRCDEGAPLGYPSDVHAHTSLLQSLVACLAQQPQQHQLAATGEGAGGGATAGVG